MNLKIIETIFKKINNRCTFIIYPLLKTSDLFGTYDISITMYQKLFSIFSKKYNVNKITQTSYQFRDMELIKTSNFDTNIDIYTNESNNDTFIKKYIYQELGDNMIVNVININRIEPNCFPILNKYDNEVQQELHEFKMNYVKLILNKENDKYYFFINFLYNVEKEQIIINDLQKIKIIIDTLL